MFSTISPFIEELLCVKSKLEWLQGHKVALVMSGSCRQLKEAVESKNYIGSQIIKYEGKHILILHKHQEDW